MIKKIYLEATNKISHGRKSGEHDLNRGDIFSLFSAEIITDIEKVVIFGRTDIEFCLELFKVSQTIKNLIPTAEVIILTQSVEFKNTANLPVNIEIGKVSPEDIDTDSIFISAEGNVFPYFWQGEFSDRVVRLNALTQLNSLYKVITCELFTELKHRKLEDITVNNPELLEFHVEKLPYAFTYTNVSFPDTTHLTSFVKSLADRIFKHGLFSDKPSGIKFYIDEFFNEIESTDKLMVVPWLSPSEEHKETFFVISGDYLNDITPESSTIFKKFNDAGIYFSYHDTQGVCVLIGMETVFRHTDIGGRCVFNQTLWGAEKFDLNIWEYGSGERWRFTEKEFLDLPPKTIVKTVTNKIWVMDTTKDHSSVTTVDNDDTLGIINLQCTIPFAYAVDILKQKKMNESD
jgi:hypothetical protein